MLVVGLTGGIGSGKSTVAARFARLGVRVIDTDVIARELTARSGAALPEIRARFGNEVFQPSGELDRDALRRLVFSDADARHDLEAILHPRIRTAVLEAVAQLSAAYAVVVIPLLVETGGYAGIVDRVLVVDCPQSLQIERVMARSAITRDEVEAILKAQASRNARLAVADDVLENTGGTEDLDAYVLQLHQRYLAIAALSSP